MVATHTAQPPRLAGRAKEVDQLDAVIRRVEAGEPQYAAIEGLPGMGKTTLINSLIERTPTWRHLVVELDPNDEEIPGSAVRRLFSSLTGTRPTHLSTQVEGLVQQLLNVVSEAKGKTCLVIEDVQWIDQLSAEVLWRTARELEDGHSLVVVSYRPNTSTFTTRIDRFLASGRRGVQLTLSPMAVTEVKEVLQDRLGVPVSLRVARIVHEATNGIPLLLNTVANWLATARGDQRQLSTALAALDSMHDGHQRIFNNALLAALNGLDETQRYAVTLLAAAGRAMRLSQIQRIVTDAGLGAVSASELISSGLVVLDQCTMEISIAHPQLAPLIERQLPIDQRVQLHETLAANSEGELMLQQRVRSQMLAPNEGEASKLVQELEHAADRAIAGQRPETAFRYLQWALWFREDPRLLHAALRCAILSDPARLLPTIRTDLDRAPGSRAVSAATAYLHLGAGEIHNALNELQRGFQQPDDVTGTVLLGHALAAAGRACYSEGLYGHAAPVMREALTQLEQAHASLSEHESDTPLLSEIRSLQAVLTLWAGLRDDPSKAGDFIAEMHETLAQLAHRIDTEAAADTIRSVVGTLTRQQGDLATAYAMLNGAYERNLLGPEFMVNLAGQLGWIAFQSAYWDEAQQLLDRALEDTLLMPEDAGVAFAHASAAVVPLARGEKETGDALLARATERDHGEVVNVTVWLARALEAMMREDYEGTAKYFSLIDEVRLGWAHVGHCYIALYARALVFTARADLVPRLRRRVDAEAAFIPEALREAIHATLTATLTWFEGNLGETFRHLRRTVDLLDTLPPVRPGAIANPGGGHALFRAFAASDIAELAFNHPDFSQYRSEAIRLSQESAAVFLRCGATKIHERVSQFHTMLVRTQELTDSDVEDRSQVDPRTLQNQAYDRLQVLSSRERQIALEVAQGKGNREIATDLYLSVRTVEYHVANCLSKLDLASRVELRHALRPALEVRLVPARESVSH